MVGAVETPMIDSLATAYYKRRHLRKNGQVSVDEECASHVHVHTHASHGQAHGSAADNHGSEAVAALRIIVRTFPYKYWATLLTCVVASTQAALIRICIDRSMGSWRLGWDLQLITILYSGVLASAACFSLISWVITQRGPMYPPMFNPLSVIFVALLEAFFIGGSQLTVGRCTHEN
ncbi:hypothetical protein Dimus_027477 [Dionaea muscipula]